MTKPPKLKAKKTVKELLEEWNTCLDATQAARHEKNKAQLFWQGCLDLEKAAWLRLQDAQWNEQKTSDAHGQPVEQKQ